jgi:outer membrane protein assembly factor BamB
MKKIFLANIKNIIYIMLFLSFFLSILNIKTNCYYKINIEKQEKINKLNNYLYKLNNNIFFIKENCYVYSKDKFFNKILFNKYKSIEKFYFNKINFVFIKNKNIYYFYKKNKFKININGLITSNIKITNNYIYFITNCYDLNVINRKTGKLLWKYSLNIDKVYIELSKSKIITSKDKLYIIIPDKRIILLDKFTGNEIYSNSICLSNITNKTSKNYRNFKKIRKYKDKIYICYSDGNFIVINCYTGRILWKKTKLNYENFIIYKKNLLIVKKNNHLTMLNRVNGNKIWTNRTFSKKITNYFILNKLNTIIIFNKYGYVYFLDKRNGFILSINKITNIKINDIFLNKSKKTFFIFNKNKVIKIKLSKKND